MEIDWDGSCPMRVFQAGVVLNLDIISKVVLILSSKVLNKTEKTELININTSEMNSFS